MGSHPDPGRLGGTLCFLLKAWEVTHRLALCLGSGAECQASAEPLPLPPSLPAGTAPREAAAYLRTEDHTPPPPAPPDCGLPGTLLLEEPLPTQPASWKGSKQ